MPITPRQLLLLGTPLVGILLALTRPGVSGPPDVFAQLRSQTGYWLALHVLLLPLLALLALAGYQLTASSARRAATLSRWVFGAFAVLAIAADAAVGLGSGVLVQYGLAQPHAAQATIAGAVDALWKSRLLILIVFLGAAAWWLAMTSVLIALTRPTISRQFLLMICVLSAALFANGQIEGPNSPLWWVGLVVVAGLFAYAAEPRALAAVLAASALLFSAGFAAPYGPLGLLAFLAAAALVAVPAVAALLTPTRPAPTRSRPARTTRR
jgi:hypothetical protein